MIMFLGLSYSGKYIGLRNQRREFNSPQAHSIKKKIGEVRNMEMSFEEFKEQDKYCRENNTPEGCGCTGCPGEHEICADNVRNLCGKIKAET